MSILDTLIINNITAFFDWMNEKGVRKINTNSETIKEFAILFVHDKYPPKKDEGEEDEHE